MSDLFAAVCSITTTRRRRFLWAAWWTAPPTADPFRKPDAYLGGARSREEALAEAERAAGIHLLPIEARWARAWARVLIGQPPWSEAQAGGERRTGRAHTTTAGAPPTHAGAERSVWAILGITAKATEVEVKSAFRKRALATHPDQGGNAEAFRSVQLAYKEAMKRAGKPRKPRTPPR